MDGVVTPYTIHGELTADDSHIVLIAAGQIEDIANAAKRLQLLTPLIQTSNPPGALVMPTSWPGVVQLTATFGDAWQPGPRLLKWTAHEALRRKNLPNSGLAVRLPEGLKPRPYQVDGAHMIAATGRSLLTDEMGTGKTITAILGLLEREATTRELAAPVLVIAPASMVDSWVKAWQTWAPNIRVVAWRGVPAKRHLLAGAANVYVTSYDTARADAQGGSSKKHNQLVHLRPKSLVVDECHLIKDPHAARTAAVRRISKHVQNVVALSGTPISHGPADLWPTLTCISPSAWPSRERWVERYCLSLRGDYKEEELGLAPATEAEFRTTLLGQFRRIAKADVLDQLPPKVYGVRTVELPPAWRKAYDEMEEDMLAQLPAPDPIEGIAELAENHGQNSLAVMSVLAQLTRLSQLASAPCDVDITIERDEDGNEHPHYRVTLKAPSWKVAALLEILAERPGKQTVVFAPSRQLMMLAGEAATKAGYRVGYIVGKQSMKVRTETIDSFQAGGLDVICATTDAGGVGITLTAASTVVFLQRPWSLVQALQAEDRAHRIGSEHHACIEIIDVVAENTIDTRVRAVLKEKAGQFADLVRDPRIVAEMLGGKSVTRKKAA